MTPKPGFKVTVLYKGEYFKNDAFVQLQINSFI